MLFKTLAKNLPLDPDREGHVLGWAVLRENPAARHLIDVYPSKIIAEAAASHLCDDYVIRYGSHRLGSDDFIVEAQPCT